MSLPSAFIVANRLLGRLECWGILLKKSICQSVTKFLSNSSAVFGILIQVPAPHDAIVSVQRNKIK